ncbi:MAG: excinuclease ABC subunit A [Alphaproteobacteria bacterium]|jgi:excinuclease ABC subunit A
MQKSIIVQGAREHNLKNVSIELPRNSLIVFTGLSGSGKSSLAFDTIYAEGQRRYVESLSAYARQFLEQMQKPDVDHIEGLSPAIAIEQKTTSKNPRSTVGTVTEIYDYMRLLWARAGIPYSPTTGLPISSQTISEMVDRVLDLHQGSKLYLLAPIVRQRKGEYKKELADLQKKGFARLKVDNEFYDISEVPALDKKVKHTIEVVVDRIIVSEDIKTRLADSFETALRLTDGIAIIEFSDTKKKENVEEDGSAKRIIFSEKFACPVSGFTIAEIVPRMFSFNAPQGACVRCDGLGVKTAFNANMVVPNEKVSLKGGAIHPWAKSSSPLYMQTLDAIAKHHDVSANDAWCDLPEIVRKVILFGSGKDEIHFIYDDGVRRYNAKKTFEGVIPNMERRWQESDSDWVRQELDEYKANAPCDVCSGYRLKEETLSIKIGDKNIGEVCAMSIRDAIVWFQTLEPKLNKTQKAIAQKIVKEITDRLSFLMNVGLEYLSLSRSSGTLSGGESQRIRLASQIGSGLTGVLYVLDEPSIGLHQRDNTKLLDTLRNLRDLGNTVLVVEHDEEAIMSADYLVDIGPGAGVHGGYIIAHGTPEEVMKHPDSVTGKYLSGALQVPIPENRRQVLKRKWLQVFNARSNNLRGVTGKIPIGTFCCITGVSGSGKSTFTIETLYKVAAKKLNNAKTSPAPHDRIEGLEYFDKVIDIDQSPIGRTPRSNPATYTGAFTHIRDWFSELPEAKARGYKSGRFSFNVKGGRCEACQGDGMLKIEMHFLPDVYVECELCKGKRYNRETLEITYQRKSISDVLEMTISDALVFFEAVPLIREKLETLVRVGLGYVKVGQQATTLSGGEAQRIKLAKELSRKATGRTLYILDEPTTGLHFEDVRKLLTVLQELVDQGNTVITIEHNLEVIKTADWIIDFGPEGGDAGGSIIAQGTPEDIADVEGSYTAHYLKPLLAKYVANNEVA